MSRIRIVTPLAAWALVALGAGSANAGDLRLIEAAKSRNADAVRTLVQQKVDVNIQQPDGATALHWAAHRNDFATVDVLIRAGARVDIGNDFGVTPLSLASGNANAIAVVERLLEAGANPNTPQKSGETPLMTAARVGRLDVVKALLTRGADIAAREPARNQTPLMWAAAEGHLDVVRELVDRGADLGAQSKLGFTPLMFAARIGSLPTVTLLLDKGADVNHEAEKGTALLTAIVRGHVDVAKLLLDRGARPDTIGSWGYTALHWTAGSWESYLNFGPDDATSSEWYPLVGLKGPEKLEMLRALLAHGADPNARTTKTVPRPHNGAGIAAEPEIFNPTAEDTPLVLAAMAADAEAMRILVAAGADPNLNGLHGYTLLLGASGLTRVPGESHATNEAALAAAKVAIELGADVNTASRFGDTALHGAAFQGNNELIKLLVAHGARVNVKNMDEESPWHLATGEGNYRAGSVTQHPGTAALLVSFGSLTEPRINKPSNRLCLTGSQGVKCTSTPESSK